MKREAAKQVARNLYIDENMLPRWIAEFSADSLERFELSPKASTSVSLLQSVWSFHPRPGMCIEFWSDLANVYIKFCGPPLPCPGKRHITPLQTYMTNQGAQLTFHGAVNSPGLKLDLPGPPRTLAKPRQVVPFRFRGNTN